MTVLSSCGLICSECKFHGDMCQGCYQVKGRTFWSNDIPGKICPLYDCAINKNKYSRQKDHTKKAYRGIRKMLFHKEIVPGQKIAYRDLSERLKMSPTPVIQALKWLEFQGLVRHEPNRGYYTEPISLEEAREIYELREILEISLLPDTIAS